MRIAVWYHCVLRGNGINEDHAISILQEQMRALKESGLADRADEIHIGINGSDSDALTVLGFAPERSVRLHTYSVGRSELSTMREMQKWLTPHWDVLYHHIKGVQYPVNDTRNRWRRCMEKACVWNWKSCVDALENGKDTVGAHWLTQEDYPILGPGQRYWGGNFWWATSDYLMTLPPMADDATESRYEAEVWIGKSKHPPRIKDFAPHFPMYCPS